MAESEASSFLSERERWLREELRAVQDRRRELETASDAGAGAGSENPNQGEPS